MAISCLRKIMGFSYNLVNNNLETRLPYLQSEFIAFTNRKTADQRHSLTPLFVRRSLIGFDDRDSISFVHLVHS